MVLLVDDPGRPHAEEVRNLVLRRDLHDGDRLGAVPVQKAGVDPVADHGLFVGRDRLLGIGLRIDPDELDPRVADPRADGVERHPDRILELVAGARHGTRERTEDSDPQRLLARRVTAPAGRADQRRRQSDGATHCETHPVHPHRPSEPARGSRILTILWVSTF